MMKGTRVDVSGGSFDPFMIRDSGVKGDAPDINALACKDNTTVSVMVWNYHDDDLIAPASPVRIAVNGLSSSRALVHEYRIDKGNSNSYEVWKEMGSPQNPTAEQFSTLEAAGRLKLFTSPYWAEVADGKIELSMNLPRQGVSLFRITW